MEEKQKPKHRYEFEDEPLVRYSVRLGLAQNRLAKKLGNGSLSKGIRLALELAKR